MPNAKQARAADPKDEAAPFGLQLPAVRTQVPGPKTEAWVARLAAVECPAITARRDRRKEAGGTDPIVWARAFGANVEDVDGNIYVDLSSGFAVASVGHAHPDVAAAIASQSQTLMHGMGDLFPTREKVLLAERLRALTPDGLEQVIFGANGSDAVEVAIKTALIATGRSRVLGFTGGYHGMSLGALGVSGYRDSFRERFASFAGATELRLPYPGTPGSPWEHDDGRASLAQIRWYLESEAAGGEDIAALIVEPVQGRGGVVAPPTGWLRGLRELTKEYGVLLIFDEIYTGFGRTGTWFACEAEGVTPDLLCIGKSMGGGLPISACIGTLEVMAGWGRSSGEALHTSTFLGNPLNARAALATLNALESDALVTRSAELGAWTRSRLEARLRDVPGVGPVRGRGMMLGIPLVDAAGTRDAGAAVHAMFQLLGEGLITSPAGELGDVLSLAPPFMIHEEQLTFGVDTIVRYLKARAGSLSQ